MAPRVERYAVTTVKTEALQAPNMRTDVPIEAFGGAGAKAMGQVGQQMGQLGEQIGQHAKIMQDQDDRAAVKQAMSAYEGHVRDSLFSTDESNPGYFMLREETAVKGLSDTQQRMEKRRREILDGLGNEQQKRLFDSVSVTHQDGTLNSMARHAATERNRYLDATSESMVKSAVADFTNFAGDPDRMKDAYGRGFNELVGMGKRNGWGEEATLFRIKQFTSEAHKAAVERLAVSDPIKAAEFYAANISNISGQEHTQLERLLKTGVDKEMARRQAEAILSGGASGLPDGIAAQARSQGVDPKTALTIAQIESGMGRATKNPKSSARGIFQLLDGTWTDMGGTAADRGSPDKQIELGVKLIGRNSADLAKTLGRQPEPWEVYLAHQQGAAGAASLLQADPNAKAADVVPVGNVVLNGGRANMTAGEFTTLWRQRYADAESRLPEPGIGEKADPGQRARSMERGLSAMLDMAKQIAVPEQRELAESHIITQYHRTETMRAGAERANRDDAWKIALAPQTASVDQIPTNILSGVNADTMRSLMTYFETKARGTVVSPTPENQALYYRLVGMSADPERRAEFAGLDLTRHIAGPEAVPHGQWQQLVNLQAAINKKDASEEARSTRVVHAMNLLKAEATAAGLKYGAKPGSVAAETLAQFQGQLVSEIEAAREAKGGKPLTDPETLALGRRLLVQGKVPGMVLDSSRRFFEATTKGESGFYVPYSAIPKAELPKLTESGRRRLGREPTRDELANAYTYSILKGAK